MREPEFLPGWYGMLLRRRAAVVAQTWITALVLIGLAGWAVVGQRQAQSAAARLSGVQTQLAQTGIDLERLGEIEAIKHELEQQDQIVRHLGINVPASRMLAVLDELMPPRMALVDMQFRTEEITRPQSDAQRAQGIPARLDRKLRLSVTGLAPTEDELATFLTKLVAVPYFGEVELVKAEEQSLDSHLMRRFEVKFALNLDSGQAPTLAAGDSQEEMPR